MPYFYSPYFNVPNDIIFFYQVLCSNSQIEIDFGAYFLHFEFKV